MSEENKVPSLIRQGQLTDEISALLPQRVEGPWARLVYQHRRLTATAEGQLRVYREDGSSGTAFSPREVRRLFEELRSVMYVETVGTWFSAEWFLTRPTDGEIGVDVNFNYELEPEWNTPVDPVMYALDLEKFPRSEESIPTWLKDKLRDAERSPE